MDEKIKILMEKTGCNEIQAEQVLKSVAGNVKEAFDLINNLGKKNAIVVKGKFRSKNKNSYGIFILILNKAKESIDHIRTVMSYESEIYKISVRDRWDIFDRELVRINLRRKEEIERLSLRLKSGLKDSFLKTSSKKKLFKYLKELELNNFKDYLVSNIGAIIKDTVIESEVEVDNISSFTFFGIRLKEGSKEEEGKETGKEVPKEEEKEKIILKIAPVIAPVSGVRITDLKVNDRMLIYVVDKTELGLYLAELMGARKEEKLIPIISPVFNIENVEEDKIKLMVKMGSGIFGEAVVFEEINIVKLFAEEEEEEMSLNPKREEYGEDKKKFFKSVFFVLAVVFLVLFFWIILK